MTATEQIPRASSDEQARLDDLYPAFAAAHLAPLWLQREGLMPAAPQPDAQPALWRWSTLLPLAERPGSRTAAARVAGSAVWQVFDGTGTVRVGPQTYQVAKGDLFAVPSWAPLSLATPGGLDAFRFSDEPVFAALKLVRTARESVSR
jgi:gentisate 1,2-dioxygenase